MEITFWTLFLIVYRHFFFFSVFIEFLLCNSFTSQQRRWFFYFPLRILLHERVRARATKSCRTWIFLCFILCISFDSENFSYTLFKWATGMKNCERKLNTEREKVLSFRCVCKILMRFNATKQPFPTWAGAAVSEFPPSILSFSFTYTSGHFFCRMNWENAFMIVFALFSLSNFVLFYRNFCFPFLVGYEYSNVLQRRTLFSVHPLTYP